MVSLVLALAVLIVLLWLTLMVMWWHNSENAEQPPLDTSLVDRYSGKALRLVRRGWYATQLYAAVVLRWSNKRFATLFFRIFPNAEPAFAKRDYLAGLKHGPSSYFLHTITEDQKKSRRRGT